MLGSSNVFYWVASQHVAKTLCRLLSKEYSSQPGVPAFLLKSADEVEQDEQVLLDEALDWVAVYGDDPDPGVYDPPPPKGMMIRAEYARRARDWEPIVVARTGAEKNGSVPGDTNQIPNLETGEVKLAGTAHESLPAQEKVSQSRSPQPHQPSSPPTKKGDGREHPEDDRLLSKYRSNIKRAILVQLTKQPRASDAEICRGLDADGAADLPENWKNRPSDRLFFSAYSGASTRHKVEVAISKVRQDLRRRGLLV